MTEQEWLTTADHPWDMLEFMLELTEHRASQRKWRLFLCAICRRVWHLIPDPLSRKAVKIGEKYADGEATETDLAEARLEARKLYKIGDVVSWAWLASSAAAPGLFDFDALLSLSNDAAMASEDESAHHCHLLREIIGNPFRPMTLDPSWLTPNVVQLARTIYDKETFFELPILADALEEAGCTKQDILNHSRQDGEHVRGCWVVDLLLGRK
jgi:hypothetical protein